MRCFYRSKLTIAISLCLAFMCGLTFVLYPKVLTHAASTSSQLTCRNWSVATSPSPGSSQNNLNASLATSSTDIWAVGSYGTSDYSSTLTEHWNGASWSVISSPNMSTYNSLSAITNVPGTNQMWAVGSVGYSPSQTLIEHWDGTSWSIVSSPNASTYNYLTGITAVNAKNIWAVGSYTSNIGGSSTSQTLIEHWNGAAWSIVSSPNFGASSWLNGVVEVTAKDIWAVGAYNVASSGTNVALTLQWNGTNWTSIANPGVYDDILNAVTRVPGTNNIFASGYEYAQTSQGFATVPLIEYWNGTSWSSMSSPATVTGMLYGMTALSAKNAWVVGSLIEHWNGTSWSVISNPNPGSPMILNAVTRVPNTQQVYAVGHYGNSNGLQTLIETNCQ